MVGEREPGVVGPTEANPLWPSEAWHAIAYEWREYAGVVAAVTRRPRRFAAQWADGARQALNPALCALNAAALIGAWTLVCHRVLVVRSERELPLWAEALKPIMVFVQVLFVAVPGHAVLRLVGARRPLRTTVGVMLFAFSGPIALISLLATTVTPWLEQHALDDARWRTLFWSEQALLSIVMIAYLTAALAGASRVRAAYAGCSVILMFIVAEVARHALLSFAPTLFHLLV